jgi:hypothetical protein
VISQARQKSKTDGGSAYRVALPPSVGLPISRVETVGAA